MKKVPAPGITHRRITTKLLLIHRWYHIGCPTMVISLPAVQLYYNFLKTRAVTLIFYNHVSKVFLLYDLKPPDKQLYFFV